MILSCPRCEHIDGQGAIYKARILDLGSELYICDECKMCWTINQKINVDNGKKLATFLEEHNLTYENFQMEDLGYLEEK